MAAHSAAKTFILVKQPLDYSTTDPILGRLVSDPGDPVANFAPSDLGHLTRSFRPEEYQATPAPKDNFRIAVRDNSSGDGLLKFLDFLNLGADSQTSRNIVLQAEQVTMPRLRQFRKVFNLLVSHETMRQEIYNLFKTNSGVIYMAVGVLVLKNGSVSVEEGGDGGFSCHASIQDPAGLAQSLARMGVGARRARQGSVAFSWQGEQVIAVEYCKVVKHSIFSWGCPELTVERVPFASKNAVYGAPKAGHENPISKEELSFGDVKFLEFNHWETGKIDVLSDTLDTSG
ncbi:hypothetical protein HIM_00465 [Hirsutella minnesotensis 3608]|nr:hypothetical protein HIM_00465 [Hirsutella minnesotensis 3608]